MQSLSIINKDKNNYSINKECNFVKDLRNIFLKTDTVKIQLDKAFKNKPLKFAFIFGSFANQNYTSDSDIDLFIIGNITNAAIIKTIHPLEKQLEREINPIVWSLADLKKKKSTSLIKTLAKKEIIMLKGTENELRKIIGAK